jgi:CHASE2 domain-containing sensor protein
MSSSSITLVAPRIVGIALLVAVTAKCAPAGDRWLRAHYYALRGERASHEQVVVVAVDGPSIEAWGPPPYRSEVLAHLAATILRGAPRSLEIADAPSQIGDHPRSALASPTEHAVDMVNFVGRRFPTVSAREVVRGAIPSEAFARKDVIIGLTAASSTRLIPTPVGPLPPAVLRGHARATVADDAGWAAAPRAITWLLAALMIVLAAFSTRLSLLGSIASVGIMSALILVLDYGLFVFAYQLGATLPLGAIVATVLVEVTNQQVQLDGRLRELARTARMHSPIETMRTARVVQGAVERARASLGWNGCIWGPHHRS